MKYIKIFNYLFFIALFVALTSVTGNASDDNSITDDCSIELSDDSDDTNTQSFIIGLLNADATPESHSTSINNRNNNYISTGYYSTTGTDDDSDQCLQTIKLTGVSLDSVILSAVNQYLPKLYVIKTIFRPPKA